MLTIAGMLLGGVGLFMLAVAMITGGLKLAAGNALKDILARYTRTPMRGVASGILITGVVQSSSAVTVATIGFVNAGLLTLGQSLGVVYGANVGTTMTGWLVATVGFGFKLETLALPLVGIGVLGRLLGTSTRLGALGEALAGFGLFFIGIDVLRSAFEGFSATVDVAAFAPQGGLGVALYVALGFFMTLVTQSSSAAIALTLTAASGGALTLEAAAATVIGANLGTTSTAALAAIGATANARRVAAAHVVFNGITGLAALALLPVMLWLVQQAGSTFDQTLEPAAVLAGFHTAFNLLGVVMLWPFTARLTAFLESRFVTRSEALARPQYLDQNVLVTPALALQALKLELLRALTLARAAGAAAVGRGTQPPDAESREQWQGLRGLLDATGEFVNQLEGDRLPADLAAELPLLLRTSNYLDDVANQVVGLGRQRGDLAAVARTAVAPQVAAFQDALVAQIALCDPTAGNFDPAQLQSGFKALEQRWHELKATLLEAAGRKALPIVRLNGALEGLRSALRLTEHLTKAAVRFPLPDRAPDALKAADPTPI